MLAEESIVPFPFFGGHFISSLYQSQEIFLLGPSSELSEREFVKPCSAFSLCDFPVEEIAMTPGRISDRGVEPRRASVEMNKKFWPLSVFPP